MFRNLSRHPGAVFRRARIFDPGLIFRVLRKQLTWKGEKRVQMRRLLLSVVVLAGLSYLGRQYGGGIGRLFGTSTGALS